MSDALSRRDVLKTSGAVMAGAAIARGETTQPAEKEGAALPMNVLGKTGVKVTRLGMGASISDYDRRLLNYAFRQGVRYFDNADGYVNGKAESMLGTWVRSLPRREDVFVVSKTHARDAEQFYNGAVRSLKQMQVDTIDLYFVHGINRPEIPLDAHGEWRKAKERLQREKIVKFVGFSTHADMPARTACLENAVKGGWVDALMAACDPGLIKANPGFDKAIDSCAKAGIGLVCMKTTRGLGKFTDQPESAQDAFKAMGLLPVEAMLKGMWSDGRFACVVSEMANFQQMEANTKSAWAHAKPFEAHEKKQLHDAMQKLTRATCPGCDGGCRLASGTPTDFSSIARYLCYYEQDGKRASAREMFAALPPEARDWSKADLAAASAACCGKLDFEALLKRVERTLA